MSPSTIYYIVNTPFIKMGLWGITMLFSILTTQISDNVTESGLTIAYLSVCLILTRLSFLKVFFSGGINLPPPPYPLFHILRRTALTSISLHTIAKRPISSKLKVKKADVICYMLTSLVSL